jgi:amino acid efflux transporter
MMLSGLALCMLSVYYFFDVDLQTALLIPSGAAILVYIIGSGAGIRLLHNSGSNRLYPWISLIMSILVFPFVGVLAFASILTCVLALLYFYARNRPKTSAVPLESQK